MSRAQTGPNSRQVRAEQRFALSGIGRPHLQRCQTSGPRPASRSGLRRETSPAGALSSARRLITCPTRQGDRSSADRPALPTRVGGPLKAVVGSHATQPGQACYPPATELRIAPRKRPSFPSRSFAALRRTFACTPRFLAVLRILCVEWRRRESNPRPRTLRQSFYKLRLPLIFARRPVGSRPTAGLAILRCRAPGDWLSLGAEPVR